MMLGGILHGIKWITWLLSQVGGIPSKISLNTLECLSMTLWRSREIDWGLDVLTFGEQYNCAITPWCPFSKKLSCH